MKKSSPQAPALFPPTQKPDIVLIHGFRGSPIGLHAIANLLRQAGYRVHIPAIPPFGGAAPLDNYTAEDYANFLAAYIEQRQLERPVLIGHSMGSIIAAATGVFYPQKVNHKIILMSPISAKTAKPFTLIAPLSSVIPRHIIDYLTTRFLFVPHNHALFRETLDLTNLCSADQPPARPDLAKATYFSAHSAISEFPLRQQVLIIAGDRDRLVSKRKTVELAHALQAQLVFIPGSGHLHNYEKPFETAQHILDFLEDCK